MPKWSAVVSGTPDAAEFGINADHRNMTKFSNVDDEDFKKLSRALEFMIQKSVSKVEANWTLEARMKQGNQLRYSCAHSVLVLKPYWHCYFCSFEIRIVDLHFEAFFSCRHHRHTTHRSARLLK